jgi:hypothetical protein
VSNVETLDPPQPAVVEEATPAQRPSRILGFAPHVMVWTLLWVPTIRSMARGWRPIADDAEIAIGAWRSLSLNPPLVGHVTFATSSTHLADPGPLEYWFLGPFTHLDPGQGVLIGSALLCAVVLSVAISVLRRSVSVWAGVILSLVIADLAIVSPLQFQDPVWNVHFGAFWFVSFLAVAFVVGLGNLRYYPLLLFLGSVTVDSHLIFLPTVAIVLVAAPVCSWLTQRPPNYRWLGWTVAVAVVCWIGPLYQQFFDARPNISGLLRSVGILKGGVPDKTEGWTFGLRAMGRVASFNPIWASPRPTFPFTSSNDISHRNPLLGLVLVAVLVAVAVLARKHHHPRVVSMCVLSVRGMFGVLILLAGTPSAYYVSFIWVNLAIWIVGICVWLTLGVAAVTALRPQLAPGFAELRRRVGWATARTGRYVVLGIMGAACVAGLLVVAFPYGNHDFLVDWTGMARSQHMAADVERLVPKGPVDLGVIYKGRNPLQLAGDEHLAAYLLLADGYRPGLEPQINQLLGMPVDTRSPLVILYEQGPVLYHARVLPHYERLWFLDPDLKNP